jgi:hypothetical protein
VKTHLTILGDRHHGKSHALMLLAMDTAGRGGQVRYDCESLESASLVMQDLADLIKESMPGKLQQVRNTNGHYVIVLNGGGRIVFDSPRRSERGWRGVLDMHILDNVAGEPHPDALRVARGVLR